MASAEVMKMQTRLARAAARILAQDPEWRDRAGEVEDVLEDSGHPVRGSQKSPERWAQTVFEESQPGIILAVRAIELKKNPEKSTELRTMVESLLV